MSNMNIAVMLGLFDKFSQGMNKSLSATKNFATGFNGAMVKIDGALNSMTGKLAMLGVDIGVGAAVNKMIQFEDRINKIGAVARAKDTATYEKQTAGLGDEIYRVANLPDIKLNANELVDAMDIIIEKTGAMGFARANIENIGRAMRATGASGADVGSTFAEFSKYNLTAEESLKLISDMYMMGNKGAFTLNEASKLMPRIIGAYAAIGTTAKDFKNADAAMQILMMQTGNSDLALTKLSSTIGELTKKNVQDKLKSLGDSIGVDLNIRDVQGNMRDFNDILLTIANSKDKLGGNFDKLSTVFGSKEALDSIIAYEKHGEKLKDIFDTDGSIEKFYDGAENNAKSLAANLQNLQTAFDGFTNKNFAPILKEIANVMNWFSQDPKRFDILFKTLAGGFALVFGMKTISMIAQTLSGMKGLFGLAGKAVSMPKMSGGAGGAGMPVFVTNMSGGMNLPGVNTEMSATPDLAKNSNLPKPGLSTGMLASTGVTAGAMAAVVAIPQAVTEWQAANADTTLTEKERNKRKGGAVGGAVGSIGGAAAGAMAGAAIGSVVPVVGTAVGVLAGGVIGYFGGKAGRAVGEKIGEAVTKKDAEKIKNVEKIPIQNQVAELKGRANVVVDVNMKDERTEIKTNINSNINGTEFSVGSVKEAYSY